MLNKSAINIEISAEETYSRLGSKVNYFAANVSPGIQLKDCSGTWDSDCLEKLADKIYEDIKEYDKYHIDFLPYNNSSKSQLAIQKNEIVEVTGIIPRALELEEYRKFAKAFTRTRD